MEAVHSPSATEPVAPITFHQYFCCFLFEHFLSRHRAGFKTWAAFPSPSHRGAGGNDTLSLFYLLGGLSQQEPVATTPCQYFVSTCTCCAYHSAPYTASCTWRSQHTNTVMRHTYRDAPPPHLWEFCGASSGSLCPTHYDPVGC